jgi:hypothetical protein
MKIGDLVKIKYDGVVTLITEIESYPHPSGFEGPTRWYSLLDQPISFRANQIEVISASR